MFFYKVNINHNKFWKIFYKEMVNLKIYKETIKLKQKEYLNFNTGNNDEIQV